MGRWCRCLGRLANGSDQLAPFRQHLANSNWVPNWTLRLAGDVALLVVVAAVVVDRSIHSACNWEFRKRVAGNMARSGHMQPGDPDVCFDWRPAKDVALGSERGLPCSLAGQLDGNECRILRTDC